MEPETQTVMARIYTVPEVAEILRCDPKTVYRMIQKGRLTVVRLGAEGGSVRITQKGLDKFLEGDQ